MGKKDTDICKPDGWLFKGEPVGHADEQSQIRKRDGLFLRGEQLGYVDSQGTIRRRDFFVFKGEEVGQVKGNRAHDKDRFIFPGEEWGYVDGDSNICQKDCFIFKGRIIGTMKGKNKAAALGYFVLRFKEIEDRFKELEQVVRNAENKTPYIRKVQQMLSYVPDANALGDFDDLMNRLRSLEREILNEFDANRRSKEDIAGQAESLSRSTNWKAAAEDLKKLQDKWQQIRSAGKDYEPSLWQRFKSAQDEFYRRRSEHFEKEKHHREQNQYRKEKLCATAESLSHSNDTKAAIERVKELQSDWKAIGSVPKEHAEVLWERFRRACDQVFENAKKESARKQAEWEKKNRERMDNLRRKERLCSAAESMSRSTDTKAAIEQVKDLQSEWKSIGPVPRDKADHLWERFRQACDRVFQNAKEERERKGAEWRARTQDALDRKRDQADRLRESIAHDEANVDRWQETIYNLRDGGRADEIRDSLENKISDVESRIRSKKERLDDLEATIKDIDRKLYG